MRRRDFVKAGALFAGASSLMRPRMWADVPDHLWEGYPFGSPQGTNRLDHGPFGIHQDEGWFTQPQKLSLPDFLHDKVPIVNIGNKSKEHQVKFEFNEPRLRYDSPEFQKAFAELNELLATKFGDNPYLEYMDLMMYGFWGEGHTNDIPGPFPDYLTAEKTLVRMTQVQIDT